MKPQLLPVGRHDHSECLLVRTLPFRHSFIYYFLFTLVCLGSALVSCNNPASNKTTSNDPVAADTVQAAQGELRPSGPAPAWAPNITPPMHVVIEKLASYGGKPLPELSPDEARRAPTPTTAVTDIIREKNITVPPPMVDTMGKDIPVQGGTVHARIYTPRQGTAPFPMIVYYHGGGWVIADLDTYDASARGLAEQVGAVVVSVHYRQAPEHKFPTAHQDAYAAYEWVMKNAGMVNGDPARMAVVGESAGGNLAASVSMMARDRKAPLPLHQVLVYPIAGYDTNSPSYQQYAQAKPLDKPMMEWFFAQYLRSTADGASPMISLVNANLGGLPPTTIIGAEIDPLMSEGQQLSDKLKAAGVPVTYQLYNGVTHEFFGMTALLPEAKDAQALAASQLKSALQPGASGQRK